jgi:predicted small lipoprotein YifL
MAFLRLSNVVLAGLLPLALLAGCGQKGTLYLRENPPAGTKIPKPATPKPLPYPAEVVEPGKD